jgi:hypothetical protein
LNFLFQKKKEENNKLLLMASLLGCIATSIIVIIIVKSIFKKFRKKNQTEPVVLSIIDGMDASVEQLVYFNKTGYELMDKALKIDEIIDNGSIMFDDIGVCFFRFFFLNHDLIFMFRCKLEIVTLI